MQNVNWWLMALAFALGLVLTLALMIRRVKREVPEYATLAAGASAAGAGAAAAGAAGAVKLSGGRVAAVEDEPYGAGSVRVAATRTRSAHILPRLQPAASIASGTDEVSVIPGETFTSRKTGSLSSPMIRSVRERSRNPSTSCTRSALPAQRSASAGSTSAGHKKRVAPAV